MSKLRSRGSVGVSLKADRTVRGPCVLCGRSTLITTAER